MATVTKLPSGRYQAKIRKQGHSLSKTFACRKLAVTWSKETEYLIEKNLFIDYSASQKTSLNQLMNKYLKEVLPCKKSQKPIHTVIRTIRPVLGDICLALLTTSQIANYRDLRLNTVSNETVRKELLFLKRLIHTAQIDWGFELPKGNPIEMIRLPSPGKPRARRINEHESIIFKDKTIGDYCILARETGMRRGEIANIKTEHIITINSEITLLEIPETKTGTPRIIPLSKLAQKAIQGVLKRRIKADSISQAFSRACQKYGITDLRFHDLRHEATSRLFELGLNSMEVSTITGHRDLKMLLRYTHLNINEIAKKLI